MFVVGLVPENQKFRDRRDPPVCRGGLGSVLDVEVCVWGCLSGAAVSGSHSQLRMSSPRLTSCCAT